MSYFNPFEFFDPAGDYFDFMRLPSGKLGAAIGDISGNGISAALMMAGLQASLRSQAPIAPRDLGELVTRINTLMYEASSPERYAKFFYAEYEPAARALVYVNAGSQPANCAAPHAQRICVRTIGSGGNGRGPVAGVFVPTVVSKCVPVMSLSRSRMASPRP